MRRVAVIALAGCLATPPRPDRQPDVDGCTAFATAICDKRDRCSPGFALVHQFGGLETCVNRTALVCLATSQILNTGETAEQRDQCTLEYPSLSCPAFEDDDLAGACATPAGPGPIGSPCGVASECQTGYCAVTVTSVCATCQPIPKIGDPCRANFECGHALICVIPSGMTSGTCTARVPVDGPCLTGVAPCGSGLSCVGENTSTGDMGTCEPAGVENDMCDVLKQDLPACDNSRGLSCLPAGMGRTCQPMTLVGPGEMCGPMGVMFTSFQQCTAGALCRKDHLTDKNGICVAPAGDGEPCDSDATIGPPCLDPARCVPTGDGTAGICTVPDPRMCN
jgi:hypothetical protein